jgi:hypothetical protein
MINSLNERNDKAQLPMKKLTLCFAFIISYFIVQNLSAQPTLDAVRVDRNVVYGM